MIRSANGSVSAYSSGSSRSLQEPAATFRDNGECIEATMRDGRPASRLAQIAGRSVFTIRVIRAGIGSVLPQQAPQCRHRRPRICGVSRLTSRSPGGSCSTSFPLAWLTTSVDAQTGIGRILGEVERDPLGTAENKGMNVEHDMPHF